MSGSSEAQRERDVHRYFQSWQAAQGSSLNVALNVDSIAEPDLRGSGSVPRPSRDKALIALAQLAVLRLNMKHAMVSLIDGSTQFVLAEATRSLKLGDLTASQSTVASRAAKSAGSELWLGSTILSRSDAVCEHALTNQCTAIDSASDQLYAIPGLVVPDCRLDPRFGSRPYVVGESGVRFYAGVPIFSRHGHKVGVYAVSDSKPRHGLSIDELEFMQGVAQAIMEHLEWARDRVDRFKGERIVRGLAAFIEGCSTLGDDNGPPGGKQKSHSNSPIRPPEMNINTASRPISPTNSQLGSQSSGLSPSSHSQPNSPRSTVKPPSPLLGREAHTKQGRLSRMYSRVAEILRHASLADGVALFGATALTHKFTRPENIRSSSLPSPENEDTYMSEGISMDSSDSEVSSLGRSCQLLAYSLTDAKTRAEIEQRPVLSLGTLEKYYHMFPKGKTFSFTQDGVCVSSEDDSLIDQEPRSTAQSPAKRRKVRMDHTELLKKIPGVREVVFVPLFDYSEDKFAGGCFLWTSIAGRMMNLDDDLSHLRAFANSIMSEVGRINTQKNEAAKTTFIASMSHELRSPLHGILGAVEFLKDTKTDLYQSGLINSIFSCGQTLLDTLNHVLDYSKINRLSRARARRTLKDDQHINPSSSDALESLNITAVVDLAVLIEEVVDAVFAGHTFKNLTTGVPGRAPKTDNDSESDTADRPVAVALDICPMTSWIVRTQPGALRRIVMNIFGNALKYTSSGYIRISLHGQVSADNSKVDVVLRVSDTGKGMSEEFQRDRLFIPFSQEDSFQPGTGLGLSLVKQIVDSLGGVMEVKSKQSWGTEISVRLSLITASEEPEHQAADTNMEQVTEQTRGLKLTVIGGQGGSRSPGASQQIRKLSETLEATCSGWFGMTVEREEDLGSSDADIYLFCEPPSIQSMQQRFRDAGQLSPLKDGPAMVVICLNTEEEVRFSKTYSQIHGRSSETIGVIAQPCGPRKLAKLFSQCLKISRTGNANLLQSQLSTGPEFANQDMNRRPSIQPQGQTGIKLQTSYSESNIPANLSSTQNVTHPKFLSPSSSRTSSDFRRIDRRIDSTTYKEQAKQEIPNVLLVDDNKINLELLVMFMKKCGFHYQEAENGKEAVERYKEAAALVPEQSAAPERRAFDYIVMDVNMPIMNGLEATKHIREFEQEMSLPPTNVFALTGLASSDAMRDADSAGVDVFLPKPVRFANLKKLFATG